LRIAVRKSLGQGLGRERPSGAEALLCFEVVDVRAEARTLQSSEEANAGPSTALQMACSLNPMESVDA